MKTTDTIIIGAGQAELALSWYLTRTGHEHVLLERGRVGERWQSERWDSLALLTPNWLNELPGFGCRADRDGFLSRSAFVGSLESYGCSFSAPVLEGVSVREVDESPERFPSGYRRGDVACAQRRPRHRFRGQAVRAGRAAGAPRSLLQLHSSGYRSPGQLPPGGVLVVGAGPCGQQLAAELRRSGRSVLLAAGRHARMPRRYRGRDIWHWLAASGSLDETIDDVPHERDASRSPSLVLSGANGGEQLYLASLAALGVIVTGRLTGLSGRHAIFAENLRAAVRDSDERMRRVLSKIDRYINDLRTGEARGVERIPAVTLPPALRTLDLEGSKVSTVIWGTGYRRSYPWLNVDVLGGDGEIAHRRGVTAASSTRSAFDFSTGASRTSSGA